MSTLSQSIKNGQLLQAKAGPLAINQNDLVALGGVPIQLYPVQTSDYAAAAAAGASAVPLTTTTSLGVPLKTRDRAIVDTGNGDIFIADTYQGASGNQVGCRIARFSAGGAFQRAQILDSTGAGVLNTVATTFLSNGNILVFWYNNGTPYTLYFAIVDKLLNIVVPMTAIASASTNPQANASCLALTNGGFAVAWARAGTGLYFTIRDNSGNIVYNPTLIAGAPSPSSGNVSGPRLRMVNLSNGNIFVGVNDNSNSQSAARYCIYTPTGAVVKAFTALAYVYAGAGNDDYYPELEVLNGFVCMACPNCYAFVFNNAGSLISVPFSVSGPTRVKTDGTHFYVFSNGLNVVRVTTGGIAATSTFASVGTLFGDVLLVNGQWILFDGSSVYIVTIDPATAAVTQLATSSFMTGAQQTISASDFCAIGIVTGGFQVVKYLSASIVGIAQMAVASGSAGTLVTINEGGGGYITNEIKGSPGKAFDHSAAGVVGNKGAMYNNSVALKGI